MIDGPGRVSPLEGEVVDVSAHANLPLFRETSEREVVLGSWNAHEQLLSSTWRELE